MNECCVAVNIKICIWLLFWARKKVKYFNLALLVHEMQFKRREIDIRIDIPTRNVPIKRTHNQPWPAALILLVRNDEIDCFRVLFFHGFRDCPSRDIKDFNRPITAADCEILRVDRLNYAHIFGVEFVRSYHTTRIWDVIEEEYFRFRANNYPLMRESMLQLSTAAVTRSCIRSTSKREHPLQCICVQEANAANLHAFRVIDSINRWRV